MACRSACDVPELICYPQRRIYHCLTPDLRHTRLLRSQQLVLAGFIMDLDQLESLLLTQAERSQLDNLSTCNGSDAAAIFEPAHLTFVDLMPTPSDTPFDAASVSSNSSCDLYSSATSSEVLSLLDDFKCGGFLSSTASPLSTSSVFSNHDDNHVTSLISLVDDNLMQDPVVCLADLIAAQASKLEMGTCWSMFAFTFFPPLISSLRCRQVSQPLQQAP